MKYWIAYFLAFAVATTALPFIAQNSVLGQVERTMTIHKNGETVEISVEEYLLAAMITQSNGIESPECLKALAVSIRSLATACSLYGCKHESYALCDDAACCIALGCPDDVEKSRLDMLKTACAETNGIVLTYDSLPAMTLFTRCASKGTSDNAEYPYLVSVPESESCQKHVSESEHEIENELFDLLGNTEETPPYLIYDDNDKCVLAIAKGKTADVRDIQRALSLASNEFVLEIDGTTLFARCHGIGHGYGLNLCGAENMAKIGFGYEKILEFYYPKLKMNKIRGY